MLANIQYYPPQWDLPEVERGDLCECCGYEERKVKYFYKEQYLCDGCFDNKIFATMSIEQIEELPENAFEI